MAVQISGGVGPFSFSINGGITSQGTGSFNNIAPGSYTILVTDNNGCSTLSAFTIAEPDPVTALMVINNTTCSNPNGTISITATGGNGNYQYSTNGGVTYQSGNIFNNLPAGNYAIMITDVNGCTMSDAALITDAPGPDVQSVTPADVTCFNAANGVVTLNATGGTAPLQYSINNGISYQPANSFGNLVPGNYSIIVADANGCTATASASITEPAQLTATTSSVAALCNGNNNGSAAVNAGGGTAPYSYTWSNGSSGQPSAVNLIAGTYSVTVTDNNGCTAMASAIVTEPAVILVQESISGVSCYGLTNGAISTIVSGGTAPFSYLWSNATPGNSITNVGAGGYTITVTDANGCTSIQTYTVLQPAELTSSLSATATACFGTANGSVTTAVNGGTAPYSYNWSNGITSSNLNGVSAGTYTVTVTDANGCTTISTQSVTSPDPLLSAVNATAVTCNGYGDGTATVSVNGGTSPYNYNWSNGSTISTASGLNGGNINVTVTDANGCISTASILVQEPSALVVNVSGATTVCIGQSAAISAVASGGNGGYQFTWSNGITGANQIVTPGVTTSYLVNVVDSLGCPAVSTAMVVAVNPALSLSITPADTICEGDQVSISAVASGGDGGPYTYHWSGSAVSGNTILVSPSVTTTYTVTVTDGCTTPSALAATTVEVNLLPVVNFTPVPASGCAPLEVYFDNSTITTTPGAFYSWYFGDNTSSNDFEPVHWYYEPGSYTVTLKVISAEGCINQLIVQDAVTVYPVPVAGISASPPVASILHPVIDFTDTGTGSTSWLWDFGDNSSLVNEQNPQHTYLATGIYPVTLFVVNDHGCRDTAYYEVVVEGASTVYIPNAFSPNADGINDVFNVSGIGLSDVQMSIYNRWGQITFSSGNSLNGWDGTDMYSGAKCPIGVYVYVVKVKTFKGETNEFTGRVTLVE